MSDFTLTGLRVVREIVRTGSFSVAARRLGYTQSAVSRQVASMEMAAGERLFERQARGVTPTDAGWMLSRHADAVLAELDAARQSIDDLGADPPGRLRVGSFSTAMAALVPDAIAAFTARRPRTEIVLSESVSSKLMGRVASRRLDVGVVNLAADPPEGVQVETLLEDPLLVAVDRGHRLARRASVDPDELRDERWIAGSREARSELLGPWTTARWEPEVAYVVQDWAAKLGLVASGLGVTVVPGLAVPALPDSIAVVRLDHPDARRRTGVASRQGADDLNTQSFIEALRDVAADRAAGLRDRLRP